MKAAKRSEAIAAPCWKRGCLPKKAGIYRIKYRLIVGFFHPQWILSYAYWSHRRGWRNDGHTPMEAKQKAHYKLDVERPRWRELTHREQRTLTPNGLASPSAHS